MTDHATEFDLQIVGGGLYPPDAEYFIAHEWAMTADDVVRCRRKCGLRMSVAQRKDFATWFAAVPAAT